MVENDKASLSILPVFGSSVAFIVLNIFAVRPFITWIIRTTPEGEEFSDFYICLILSGVMISGFITEIIGSQAVFGAFVFGLIIPKGPLGLALVEKIEDFMSVLFVPLFFAATGLTTDLGLIKGFYTWAILLILVTLCCIGKIIGTIAVAVYYQMPVDEGVVLGLLITQKDLLKFSFLKLARIRRY